MCRIILSGCNGRMGRVITEMAGTRDDFTIAAGVDICPERFLNSYPVYGSLSEVSEDADVIVDFSNPSALQSIIDYAQSKGIGVVLCTTGYDEEQKRIIKEVSSKIPLFKSANMSIGINLIMGLAKQAARILESDFDIEIIEKHHNLKVDSPSGTALLLADGINDALKSKKDYIYGRTPESGKRQKQELGIHAVRGGSIVGEHEVIFAGEGEVIKLEHSALSRNVFASGAVRAAIFLKGKTPGLYSMDDVIAEGV